jgi:hypothetical protein
MEKNRVIIAGPLAIAGITLVLVIRLSVNCQPSGNSVFFSGIKQPMKVVVASPLTRKAFDIEGDEIPIGSLLQEIPDLTKILEKGLPT